MERLDQYLEHLRTFSTERDWDQFHTPENIAKSVSIEAGELLEAKLQKNIEKYPVEKCKGRNTKYDKL